MRLLLILTTFFGLPVVGFSDHQPPLILSEVEAPIEAGLTEDEPQDLSCAEAVLALENHGQQRAAADTGAIMYLDNVQRTMRNWYYALSPYEGRQATIRYGAFSAINQSASHVGFQANSQRIYASRFNADMDRIINVLKGCIQ